MVKSPDDEQLGVLPLDSVDADDLIYVTYLVTAGVYNHVFNKLAVRLTKEKRDNLANAMSRAADHFIVEMAKNDTTLVECSRRANEALVKQGMNDDEVEELRQVLTKVCHIVAKRLVLELEKVDTNVKPEEKKTM